MFPDADVVDFEGRGEVGGVGFAEPVGHDLAVEGYVERTEKDIVFATEDFFAVDVPAEFGRGPCEPESVEVRPEVEVHLLLVGIVLDLNLLLVDDRFEIRGDVLMKRRVIEAVVPLVVRLAAIF